jgi:hypothetical protein
MLVLRKTDESGEVSTGGFGWAHLRGVRLAVCFDSYGQRDKASPSVVLSAWRVVPIRRSEALGAIGGRVAEILDHVGLRDCAELITALRYFEQLDKG